MLKTKDSLIIPSVIIIKKYIKLLVEISLFLLLDILFQSNNDKSNLKLMFT